MKPDGGPAFPTSNGGSPDDGMTLRDYFATNAPTDEVQELNFRHLSRLAQEQLTGLKYPFQPSATASETQNVEYQIAMFEFKCAVNAAIRFKLADAMLKARAQ